MLLQENNYLELKKVSYGKRLFKDHAATFSLYKSSELKNQQNQQ